jgi:hypothetical protein
MNSVYRKCLASLYGNGKPPTSAEVREELAKKANSIAGKESEEQIKLVCWMKKEDILFYHIPNGGYRNKKEAYSLKAQGLQPGVPDLCLPIPRGKYHSLYIELKRASGGVLSHPQRWWLEQLNGNGHKAVVANGFLAAQKIIQEYLNDM